MLANAIIQMLLAIPSFALDKLPILDSPNEHPVVLAQTTQSEGVAKPSGEDRKYWEAGPLPKDSDIPFKMDGLLLKGNSPVEPVLAARKCIDFRRFNDSDGVYVQSIEVYDMDFLAPVAASSLGQTYKLPIATGDVYPVKIKARRVRQSKERQYTEMSRRGILYRDSFGEWACLNAN